MALRLKALRKIKSETILPPKIGEIVQGKVIGIERSSVFLDLGPKGIGIVYGAEFYKARHFLKNLKFGEIISAKVINLENDQGYRELSVVEASKEISWKELRELKEKGEILEVKIEKVNKGGLICEIKGVVAFLPVSHLAPVHYPRVEEGKTGKIVRALQKFIGQSLKVKIIDLDPKKEKLIISEKATELEKEKEILKRYKVGDVVEGEITGLTNFGAFVGFGEGLEGLLYPSEVPKKKGEKLEEFLRVGQKIKAKIIKIAENRVYFSLKL